jgi:nucleotide-binding universal stress UspA family protein
MIPRLSVLCAIDFTESSRAALKYATAVAEHLGARLRLLAINDPVQEAEELDGLRHLRKNTTLRLEELVGDTFEHRPPRLSDVRLDVSTGDAASEILRVARATRCDLIVMSSHVSIGCPRMFPGSTTERVLREATVPVLVMPAEHVTLARLEGVHAEPAAESCPVAV